MFACVSARVAVACPSREIREIRRCRNVAGSAAGGVGIVTKAPGYPPALPIDHTSVCLVDGQRTRDAAEVQSEKKNVLLRVYRTPSGRQTSLPVAQGGWVEPCTTVQRGLGASCFANFCLLWSSVREVVCNRASCAASTAQRSRLCGFTQSENRENKVTAVDLARKGSWLRSSLHS